jgi:hypothetical protein
MLPKPKLKPHRSHRGVTNHLRCEVEIVVLCELPCVVRVSSCHAEAPRVHHLPAQIEIGFGDHNTVPHTRQALGARRIRCGDVGRAIEVAKIAMRWFFVATCKLVGKSFGSDAIAPSNKVAAIVSVIMWACECARASGCVRARRCGQYVAVAPSNKVAAIVSVVVWACECARASGCVRARRCGQSVAVAPSNKVAAIVSVVVWACAWVRASGCGHLSVSEWGVLTRVGAK